MRKILSLALCAALLASPWAEAAPRALGFSAGAAKTPSAPGTAPHRAAVPTSLPRTLHWTAPLGLPAPERAPGVLPAGLAAARPAAPSGPLAASPIAPSAKSSTARASLLAAAPVAALPARTGSAPRALPAESSAARANASRPRGSAPLLRAELGADSGGALFDGNARAGDAAQASRGTPARGNWRERFGPGRPRPLRNWLANSPAGRLLPKGLAARWGRKVPEPRVPTRFDADEHGGPQALKADPSRPEAPKAGWLARVGYGLRWGLHMLGVAALLNLTVRPLLERIPWPLWLSQGQLQETGRVELLTGMGPKEIAGAASSDPLSFLFGELPRMVFLEELFYRAVLFGGLFLALAALKPIMAWLNERLARVPDLFGARALAQTLAEKLSKRAFKIAALLSAFLFAAAHLAAWGISPYALLVQFLAGLALARVAYRTRSLSAPFAAHFLFNFLLIGLGPVAASLLGADQAGIPMLLAQILAVSSLWYGWRAYRKDKAQALAEASGKSTPKAPRWRLLAGMGLFLSLAAAAFGLLWSASKPVLIPSQAPPAAAPAAEPEKPAEPAAPAKAPADKPLAELIRDAKPAVVQLYKEGVGTGSGFFIDPSGLIATNGHVAVMAGADREITVRFADGREIAGVVLGLNVKRDIAFIKVDRPGVVWPSLEWGAEADLLEGHPVVALGYPGGAPFSANLGHISGLGRRGNGFSRFLQHDAAINPGNSGGALLDMQGRLIGMNTAIGTHGGGFDGIGYAIPVEDIRAALKHLQEKGNLDHGYLGVILNPLSENAPEYGVWVEWVRPGSPADKAGLLPGDLITHIARQGDPARELPPSPLGAAQVLARGVWSLYRGDALTLTVQRGGRSVLVDVPLGGR